MTVRKAKMEFKFKKSQRLKNVRQKYFYEIEILQGFQIQFIKMVEEQTWHTKLIFGKTVSGNSKLGYDA